MMQQMPQAGILGGIPAPQRSRPLFRQGGGPVPGAPTGGPPMGGPPMGGPPMGGPPGGGMPGQQPAPVNPQLAGAIDLVDESTEHLDLPPETEYALHVQEAADLLASAKRELAMSQPQPEGPVVAQLEQEINQATQGGLPEIAQRLQPGHQQLGINQQRRVQQALGGGQGRGGMPQLAGGPRGPGGPGGLPQLPSNIRPQMAAQGGIVGYQRGGDVGTSYDEMGKQYLPGQPIPDTWMTLSNRDPTGPLNPASAEYAERLRRMERTRRERGDRTFLEALADADGHPYITAGDYMRDIGARRRFTKGNPNFASQLEAMKESRERVLEAQEAQPKRGAALLPETETFLEATEILENPESTEEQKAFAQMQLEGLQDAPMRAEILQQADKIRSARGGMAGGGPIKRYQTGNQVEGGPFARGQMGGYPNLKPAIEEGLGNLGAALRGPRERLIAEIQRVMGLSYEEAVVVAEQQLEGGQSQIDRPPPWFEQIPAGQVDPEIGTQVRGPIPEGAGRGQEQLPPGVPPQDALFPQEPRRAVASSGLATLPYEQAEFNPQEQRFYDEALGQAGRDPLAESQLIGERYRKLTGMEDEVAARAKEFEGLQSLREEQFSPKESLRRRWHAGLQQGQRQGLGGFGAGVGMEEDKILAERLGVRESNVENMDKLISDLRALGLGQFQAEQEAHKMVGEFRSQGATDAQALLAGLRATNNALIQSQTQRDVATITGEWQEAIAKLRNANNTDLIDQFEISARGLRRADPNLSYEESMEQAYEIYKEDQLELGFARMGASREAAADRRNIDVMLAAIESVDGMASLLQQQRGIMGSDGSINDDKRWDAITEAAERLGGILLQMEGTTTTMDQISEIVGRTITSVSELTPEEHIQLRDAGLLQGN